MKSKIGVALLIAVIGIGLAVIIYTIQIPRTSAIDRFQTIPEKPTPNSPHQWEGVL